MSKNNLSKVAAVDAANYMQARMNYGEGSGIARRHVMDAVQYKMDTVDGYHEAFMSAHAKLDPSKFVKTAHKTRRSKDVSKYVSKNARAIARGDRRNVSPSLLVVGVGAAVLHTTGYDKVIWDKSKRKYRDVKSKVVAWAKDEDRVHNVTGI